MTPFQLEANKVVDYFARGNLQAITELYDFPAVVYVGEHILVFDSQRDLLRALHVYRSILMKHHLSLVTTSVVRPPHVKGNRFTVEVSNEYFKSSGGKIGAARIRYFLQRDKGCAKIRMVEYLEWPCKREVNDSELIKQISIGASEERHSNSRKSVAKILH